MTVSKPRVMVVEDDDAIRAGLCDVLRFGGYIPLPCARGDVAVKEILAASPDLVLLDVNFNKQITRGTTVDAWLAIA